MVPVIKDECFRQGLEEGGVVLYIGPKLLINEKHEEYNREVVPGHQAVGPYSLALPVRTGL